jgi:aminoglycoside N3'-acetyltransferase
MYLDIPKSEHIMIHARLVNLLNISPKLLSYKHASIYILDAFSEFDPLSIVVPSFTYSFTNNLNFSIKNSKSDIGRFSEEVRMLSLSKLRTLDPIFSVIDVKNFGWQKNYWNDEAFGMESIWESWDKCNGIIVNIDLPEIVSTQIHYIEKNTQVPYRFNKVFCGNVSDMDDKKYKLKYNYYVRDLRHNFVWNRSKIMSLLKDNNAVFSSIWNDIPIRWFRAKDLRKVLQPVIMSDPYYLLSMDK